MRKNLIYKLLILLVLVTVFILEFLPNGVILNFSNQGSDELIRRTYSYFSLTPFGYANFGPLLTGIVTILLMVLMVIFIFKDNVKIFNFIKTASIIAVIFSLMPLLLGINYFSLIGMVISALLQIIGILVFLYKKFVDDNKIQN